jgi:hypothetical protein
MPVTYLHLVLFNFKDEISSPERDRVIASIRSQGSFPGVESILVARNLLPGSAPAPFEWIVMLDFADEVRSLAFRNSDFHRQQVERDFTPNHRGFITLNLHQPFDRKISENFGNAFRRIILFNFLPRFSETDRSSILAAIEAHATSVGVNRLVIGRNVMPRSATAPLEWLIMMESVTREDYEAMMKTAKAEAAMNEIFAPACAEKIVFDLLV